MRVVHFSDWHSAFDQQLLPYADVYVCTGDMLPNFPLFVFENKKTKERKTCTWQEGNLLPMSSWLPVGRKVEFERERKMQAEWLESEWPQGTFRAENLPNKNAPVVCIRGNHDFIDLAPLFAGGPVYEIHSSADREQVFEIEGVRFGGMRGINRIYGEWSDEKPTMLLQAEAQYMPLDLDVFVTHAPPKGLLDYAGDNYGVQAYRDYLERNTTLRAHFFGHIHEQGGKVQVHTLGEPFSDETRDVTLSNAATKVTIVEL